MKKNISYELHFPLAANSQKWRSMPFQAKRKSNRPPASHAPSNMQMNFSISRSIRGWAKCPESSNPGFKPVSNTGPLSHVTTIPNNLESTIDTAINSVSFQYISVFQLYSFLSNLVIANPPLNSSTLSFWEHLLALKKHRGIPRTSPNCAFSSASRLVSVAGTQAFFSQRQSPRCISWTDGNLLPIII